MSTPLERLRQHFDRPTSEQTSRWDELWKSGDFLPWDRGVPNPALVDTLNDRRDLIGEPTLDDPRTGQRRRKRALVPGCGAGHDVLLLASYGYDAYGLEASKHAVQKCEELAAQNADRYPAKRQEVGSGSVHFVYGDFFKQDWLDGVHSKEADFDLIYDYTVSSFAPFGGFSQWRRASLSDTLVVSLCSSSQIPSGVVTSHVAVTGAKSSRLLHLC